MGKITCLGTSLRVSLASSIGRSLYLEKGTNWTISLAAWTPSTLVKTSSSPSRLNEKKVRNFSTEKFFITFAFE